MKSRGRLLLLASALVLLLSACADSEPTTTVSIQRAALEGLPQTIARPYFVRDGTMAVSGRRAVLTPAFGKASIAALLRGPTTAERRIGFTTAVPEKTALEKITKKGDRMTVSFTRNLNRVARAQVVTTLTRFKSVHDVVIVTPSGRTQPLHRADFEALMPAVLVESPLPFAQVRSPLRVSGSSNTFEATSQLELLDANGKLLVSKTVTASSGTGTRGTFSVNLRFRAGTGPATLVSFEYSAKDGSRTDVVKIPVRISRSSR